MLGDPPHKWSAVAEPSWRDKWIGVEKEILKKLTPK